MAESRSDIERSTSLYHLHSSCLLVCKPSTALGCCVSAASAQRCCKRAVGHVNISMMGSGLTKGAMSAQHHLQNWPAQGYFRVGWGSGREGGTVWREGVPMGRGGSRIQQLHQIQTPVPGLRGPDAGCRGLAGLVPAKLVAAVCGWGLHQD